MAKDPASLWATRAVVPNIDIDVDIDIDWFCFLLSFSFDFCGASKY